MEYFTAVFNSGYGGTAMIELNDLNELFKLISRSVQKNLVCYAFGGNAMMHYGYKNATKDIDIIFDENPSREEFIRAIRILGYEKKSLLKIYSQELLKEKNKPELYSRGDERFDIFFESIFQTKLSKAIKERAYARLDFAAKENTLTVFVLSKEDIILLKSVTQREKDFDDILTIVEREKEINWKVIVDEAVWQAKHGDKWAVVDLEQTFNRLKRHTLIKKEYFDVLYKAV
jgi:hypothetical protein